MLIVDWFCSLLFTQSTMIWSLIFAPSPMSDSTLRVYLHAAHVTYGSCWYCLLSQVVFEIKYMLFFLFLQCWHLNCWMKLNVERNKNIVLAAKVTWHANPYSVWKANNRNEKQMRVKFLEIHEEKISSMCIISYPYTPQVSTNYHRQYTGEGNTFSLAATPVQACA